MNDKRIFTILTLLFLFQFTASHGNAATGVSPDLVQQVSAYPQPDSPLHLSVLFPKWEISSDAKWQMLQLHLRIENVRDKAIRAYAIHVFEGDLKSKNGVLSFINITSAEMALRPHQSREEEVPGGGYPGFPGSLLVAVDFVEYTDGSTWGEDVFESASRLDGQRAGARATLKRLRELQGRGGVDELVRVIDQEVEQITPPSEQKEVWKDGFKQGAASIRERVRRTYKKGGAAAAEVALKKPYDTATEDN